MTMEIFISTAVIVAVVTLVYKALPHRQLPEVKSGFTLFPKYQTSVDWGPTAPGELAIEEKFAESRFELSGTAENEMHFQRGHLLGDFSLKLVKLRCRLTLPENGSSILTVEGGWMIAFDTGDLWTITSELKRNLPSESVHAPAQAREPH